MHPKIMGTRQSGEQDSWLERAIHSVTKGFSHGFKFGPGVLATIIPIVLIGLVVLGGVGFSLRAAPIFAIAALLIIAALIAFIVERSFRYAEQNPLPALMNGGQIIKLYREQLSAKHPEIVIDQEPVAGIGSGLDTEGRPDE